LHQRTWVKRQRNRILLPILIRLIRGIMTIGTRNMEFWWNAGLPRRRMFTAPYPVDDRWWSDRATHLTHQRTMLRRKFGFYNRLVFLSIARFIPEKDLQTALRAVNLISSKYPDLLLVLVGGGPEERTLRLLANEHHVLIKGFIDANQIAAHYAASDVLVIPSKFEQWGLAINEAMFFRLPVIATSIVGAVPDLVFHKKNGLVVEPRSPSELAGAMRYLYEHPEERRRMGEESRRIIEEWDGFNRSVQEFIRILS